MSDHSHHGIGTVSRRHALCLMLGATSLAIPAAAFGAATDNRLVVFLLRGALDGLHAVPAFGDPAYSSARNGLALQTPGGADRAFALDGMFGLHPRLQTLHSLYNAGEMTVLHAVATAYRERSHFDAQNVLETGARTAFARNSGWLNAAMAALPPARTAARAEKAIAMGGQAPLILRGSSSVATWSPSPLPDANTDTVQRLMSLYQSNDEALANALDGAIAANAIAANAIAGEAGMMGAGGRAGRQVAPAAKAAAAFLNQPNGPVAAVIEVGGWDSHVNQGQEGGQIATLLGLLDQGVATLKADLGPRWAQTAVLIVTEFGRTVAANGNRGTDHGTGAVAFLLGGAVRGGRVIADWPGLARNALYEGRDIRPTTDLRAVMKGVLGDHLGVPRARLDADIFPESVAVNPMQGLMRG